MTLARSTTRCVHFARGLCMAAYVADARTAGLDLLVVVEQQRHRVRLHCTHGEPALRITPLPSALVAWIGSGPGMWTCAAPRREAGSLVMQR